MLLKGRYRARFAESGADVAACQRLRHLCFVDRRGGAARDGGLDRDGHDPLCRHVMVEEARGDRLVCCFRLLPIANGREIGRSYAAQYYGLDALADFDAPMVEMGRFCIHPEVHNADVLRVAWAAMTRYVDEAGVEMVFGCSSFEGTEAAAYLDAFTLLDERHLAPKRWLPRVKAPDVVRFAEALRPRPPDRRLGMLRMPPLLRSYLVMGGWVSDHAVVDHDLGTLHVFTGLEIRAIPPDRARALRAVAS